MSASLVGSEMCIRDSANAWDGPGSGGGKGLNKPESKRPIGVPASGVDLAGNFVNPGFFIAFESSLIQ
eukprot:14937180-Alexandrium_andersonii.AAC.1